MASAILVAALALWAAVADILPPGHKSVVHELVVLAGGDLSGWRLVAGPQRGFGPPVAVELGEPFPFSSKYGTRIYAVSAAEPLPEGGKFDPSWGEGRPVFGPMPREVASAPATSPLARVLTTYRFVGIDGDEVKLELVGEERFSASGAPLDDGVAGYLMLGVAVLGLAGLGVTLRVVRRHAG